MAIVLGAIADDFTGATDLAGLLARSGYPVSLRFGLPDEDHAADATTTAPFEIIALKCRTIPVDGAVRFEQPMHGCKPPVRSGSTGNIAQLSTAPLKAISGRWRKR
jgi:hypothetical protein